MRYLQYDDFVLFSTHGFFIDCLSEKENSASFLDFNFHQNDLKLGLFILDDSRWFKIYL